MDPKAPSLEVIVTENQAVENPRDPLDRLRHALRRARMRSRTRAAEGFVSVGGRWFGPHLSTSYARAARQLHAAETAAGGLHHVVVPFLYLVRHAVELALKELLVAYQRNHLARVALDEIDRTDTWAKPLPAEALHRKGGFGSCHDLRRLLEWVNASFPQYVSPIWSDLVEAIVEFEEGHADRTRYATIGKHDPKSGARSERSFGKRKEIQLAQILENFEVFMAEAVEIVDLRDAERWSALQDLDMESQNVAEELHQRGL